jgi:hypothetical protein
METTGEVIATGFYPHEIYCKVFGIICDYAQLINITTSALPCHSLLLAVDEWQETIFWLRFQAVSRARLAELLARHDIWI